MLKTMAQQMTRITVSVPIELKEAVDREAHRTGASEAEYVRRSLTSSVESGRPMPRGGVFASGDPFSDRVDELLDGFGEQ